MYVLSFSSALFSFSVSLFTYVEGEREKRGDKGEEKERERERDKDRESEVARMILIQRSNHVKVFLCQHISCFSSANQEEMCLRRSRGLDFFSDKLY